MNQELFYDIRAGERMKADLVAKVRFKGQDACFLIHIEPQSDHQHDFPWRMFRYFARLHEQHRLPVYPIALYSFDSPKQAAATRYAVDFPDGRVLDFRFRAIQLNRLDWRDYRTRPNPVASALMAKMAIAKPDRPKVKLECLDLMVGLQLNPARMQLIAGFVDTYLRLTDAEQREFRRRFATELTPPAQEKIMELTTSWEEKGLRQGRLEGRLEGEATVLKRQLTRRFGSLSNETLARLEQASTDQLEQWADNILDAVTLDDVFKPH